MIGAMTVSDAPAPGATSEEVADWIRRGREAMRDRRYRDARDWFDRAIAARPDDPQVQGLAVTAEFWRRLARDGDGFAPADAPLRRRSKDAGTS